MVKKTSDLISKLSEKLESIEKKTIEGELISSSLFSVEDKPSIGSFEWKLWVLRKSIEACMYFDDTNGRYVIIDGRTLVACMQEANKMEGHYKQLAPDDQNKLSATVDEVKRMISHYRKEY